ncbi:MAG: multidrug effflux MFS transporter [Granulosicoccus sp.]|nr:multidrug effflux MFS transporter [Granulosicoccus sp.]
MALMAALDAVSIDGILPALDQIASDLGVVVSNRKQYVVTALFLGFSAGVLVYGFAADTLGRRRPVMAGFVIYILGTLVCLYATSFSGLLSGRVLQGFGAAGPYVLSVAIVRDLYRGRQMARALSLIMMVFIGVPMLAPFLGQGILLFTEWRGIFAFFLVFALVVMGWFWARQPETLKPEHKRPADFRAMRTDLVVVICHPQSIKYILALGAMTGAFIAYLSTAQQVFQDMYGLGLWFPAVFAALASLFGIASFLNSRWVESLGMARLIHYSLCVLVVASALFFVRFAFAESAPPFFAYVLYVCVVMPVFAFCFSNTTSLALEPHGARAGAASSIVNSISTFIAIALATAIGSLLQENVLPVVGGFGVLCLLAAVLNYPKYRLRETQHLQE